VLSKIPKIDILINNAGVIRRGTIFESTEKEFDLLFDVNVKGSWLMIREAKEKLSEKAIIVQISSGHALRPGSDPGIYTLTKQTTLNLANMIELTCPNYLVKVVCPGPVNTPLARYGRTKKDVQRIIKISHKPKYVASKIIELLESNKRKLLFEPKSWDYIFE